MSASKKPIQAPSWILNTLQSIDAPVNAVNVIALKLWAMTEGTWAPSGGQDFSNNGQTRYNWLNSTLPVNGSTNCGSCQQPSVQDYPDESSGVQATAATIKGWPSVLAAFQRGHSLADIQHSIASSVPGPCAEVGCIAAGNPHYPQVMWAAIKNPIPPGGTTGGNPTSGPTGTAPGDTQTTQGGCCGHNPGANPSNPALPCNVFTIPHTSAGITYCNVKAILGGLALVGGGLLMLAGVMILARGTIKQAANAIASGSGPVGKGAMAVAQKSEQTSPAAPSEQEVTASDQRTIQRQFRKMDREAPRKSPPMETPNLGSGRPRRTTEAQRRARAEQPF